MRVLLNILSFSFILLLFNSCFRIEHYPPEPSIKLKSFTLKKAIDELGNTTLKGELCISFIDGDGDIGYKEVSDTALADSIKSIFVKKFKKINGTFVEQDMLVPMNYWIPYFETHGNNPCLKGDIIVHDLNFYPPYGDDTIKFNIYIKDRKGHKSNIVETIEFIPKDSL